MLKTAGQGILFTAGTACISYGVMLLEKALATESDPTTAIILIIMGLALTIVGIYVTEKEAVTKAAREIYGKLDERLKDLERKRG